MKKLISYLCVLLCLLTTSCEQTIRDAVVSNRAQESFSMFWHSMDSSYVFFDKNHRDWDAFYSKWLGILDDAKEDDIKDWVDSLVQDMADIQIDVWSGISGYSYDGPDSIFSKYQSPCGGWRQNYPRWENNTDPYVFDGGEENFTGACIYTIHRNGDSISAPYLYIVPGKWGSKVENNKDFWQEYLPKYAENIKGTILDLREMSDMQLDDMLELLRYFLPTSSNVIFYTCERSTSLNNRTAYTPITPYLLDGYGTFAEIPMCLLFDVQTQNEANIMSYVLHSLHPNITTISMNYTLGGGGIRSMHKYVTKDETFGFSVQFPTIRLSNNKYTTFDTPLYPDISVPYEKFVYNRQGMIDKCLVICMDVLDKQ